MKEAALPPACALTAVLLLPRRYPAPKSKVATPQSGHFCRGKLVGMAGFEPTTP